MQLVFSNKNKEYITDMLRVSTVEDFISLFDLDRDGFLNQDEQISVFSLVKEKCQILCEELAAIHEYQLYKDIMKEVRALEKDIVIYQNDLRSEIQKRQLDEYIEIGEEKLKDFHKQWECNFEDFERESMNKIEELKNQHENEMEELNMRLDRAVEAVKVKPKARLKELQTQEKLVAANERIEEAINYRKELKDFEVEEANRVEGLRHDNAMKQRNKLLSDQKKEMLQLESKIETARNNLRIKMDKELNTLQKEINLHVNDIKRIQGLISRLAVKKGETNDELRRNKDRAKKTMNQIKNARKIGGDAERTMKNTLVTTGATITAGHGFNAAAASTLLLGGNVRNMMTGGMLSSSLGNTSSSGNNFANQARPLKYILTQAPICKFDISANSGQEKRPINKEEDPTKSDMDLKGKIKTLLDQRKPPTEKMPSL
mmetsp:Transcript_29401/g.29006  ORF Transcript_29401/g.29006 Transcript_29401/m.29006 type:complete len:431 (-) Transcript_29401:57-1349(-)|eukprot:CAMPEP_0197001418 /NCGR_PEP_ID=MMETSP1380-20130617/6124_1 /TAXON_ID=5936 /ORGANISM="Euplotes crassus, Strain CT5" /LENGTH=430 /DNA_ID=CAMNT_0042419083 /DNA_START=216 /DNA_END=1508 /DNA_ORIENTATION=+